MVMLTNKHCNFMYQGIQFQYLCSYLTQDWQVIPSMPMTAMSTALVLNLSLMSEILAARVVGVRSVEAT